MPKDPQVTMVTLVPMARKVTMVLSERKETKVSTAKKVKMASLERMVTMVRRDPRVTMVQQDRKAPMATLVPQESVESKARRARSAIKVPQATPAAKVMLAIVVTTRNAEIAETTAKTSAGNALRSKEMLLRSQRLLLPQKLPMDSLCTSTKDTAPGTTEVVELVQHESL